MARNGSGVKQVSENSIEIEFQYEGKRCRERIKCRPTPANFRKLEVFRDEILAAITAGTFDYSASFPESKRAKLFKPKTFLTVSEWLNQWLDRKERHIKASTYDTYRRAILQLKEGLGDIPIKELKKKDLRRWCETKTCSNKAINNLISVLRAALQDAVDDELIDTNPLYDFRFRRTEAPRETEDVDPFLADEQLAILTALKGQHQNLIQFLFWTGLRPSEAIALEWRDVNFTKGTVHVRRAKTFHASKPETTKTKAGTREVKLLSPALLALDDQKQYTFIDGCHIFKNPNNLWC
jgi:integrase